MDNTTEVSTGAPWELQIRVEEEKEVESNKRSRIANLLQKYPKLKHYKWWLRVIMYVMFNAVFSFLLNKQKFTSFIFNSLVLVTISAALLAVHPDSDDAGSTKVSRKNHVVGFLCSVGASATYSLMLSLLELSFKKVLLRDTFDAVLDMQFYPSFIASCACVLGLFASGEWRTLPREMEGYHKGKVSYVMTLVWIGVLWQVSSVGLLGLIFEVSSLFSNVISTLCLPTIPILAVIFFHDKMDGVKVITLLLAIWGFLSYVYQHYLDGAKSRKCAANEEEEDCKP